MGATIGMFIAQQLCECAVCMACSCCTTLVNASLAQAARFGHILVLVSVFVLAIILGQSYPNDINGYNSYTQVKLTADCNPDYLDECIYRQLIYRASFSSVMVFSVLAIFSYCFDYLNRSFWILKFGAIISIFIGFWWSSNYFFSSWANVARVLSFFWLLVQGLLFLDFSHDLHDIIMSADEESRLSQIFYLVLSVGGFAAVIVGLVFLFLSYTGCGLGMFFTVLTLFMGVLTTFLSLLDVVGKGILTPSLMFGYSVFLCWYALLSNPDQSCNPTANSNYGGQLGAIIVISCISVVVLMYCVVNGTKILNIFNPEGEGVMQSYVTSSANRELSTVLTGQASSPDPVTTQPSGATPIPSSSEQASDVSPNSGTAHERSFFHVMMILVSCYACMVLTSWGKTDGSPVNGGGSNIISTESMWLIIVSQWVFLLLYLRVLQVAYLTRDGN